MTTSGKALDEGRAKEVGEAAESIAREGRGAELIVRMAELAGFDPDEVREGLAADFEAKGTIDSRVVVRTFEADTVRALLPRGLELAPQPLVGRGRHPVFFLFSNNFFEAWFGDMEYREMMVGIPFVQRTDRHIPHRGPFIYMPRLYLDETRPRLLGNLLYGFEKIAGLIDVDDGKYVVREEDGNEAARLTWEEHADWTSPEAVPNFATIRQLFEMPTVSQARRIFDRDAFDERDTEGAFICSNISYLWGEADAKLRPITARLKIDSELTPRGLRTDPHDSLGLDQHELGAFRFQAQQRVSMPGSCSDTHFEAPVPREPRRIAVIGGGPASCAAAFYLAQQKGRYRVSMYTNGWRLGGKCAAGRSDEYGERIEEHGLHAFVGFYENVFRTIREVYDEAGLPLAKGEEPYDHANGEGPIAEAFIGTESIGLLDKHGNDWKFFNTGQQLRGGVPGSIPKSELDELPGPGQILLAVFERIRMEIRGLEESARSSTRALVSSTVTRESSWWRRMFMWLRKIVGLEPREEGDGGLGRALDRLTDFLQEVAVEQLGDWIVARHPSVLAIRGVLVALRALLKERFDDNIEEDAERWFSWVSLDLSITVAIGIIDARTIDLSTLDDQDFREWLLAHGLDPKVKESAPVTFVYNTLYANNNSGIDRLAAGVALRWFLLVGFGFKGFPAYDFKWSCPQTVFTPYYRALKKLGVEIHFFHELTDIEVSGTNTATRKLESLKFKRQARLRDGVTEYVPFAPTRSRRDPESIPAWPIKPLWNQLVDEDASAIRDAGIDLEDAWSGWEGVGEVELVAGRDFDDCVLGVSLGALREPARHLYDPKFETADPAWTGMMDAIPVIETASFQLWFRKDREALWTGEERDLLTGYAHPWPSAGDFSHLLEWEGWSRDPDPPKFLAYHTGALEPGDPVDSHPLTEREWPAERQAEIRERMKQWLRDNWRGMYDKLETWDDFLDALWAPAGAEGEARLDAQYFHSAFQPSMLYVLSQPGTVKARLGQAESGYKNLFLCGDWTRTDMNCGCVEAATQSGMLASKAISRFPTYIWHPGF